MKPRRIALSVPATSANLGPGFDCLGIALSLRNTYILEPCDAAGLTVEIEGEGADTLPRDRSNFTVEALEETLRRLGKTLPDGLRLHCRHEVPAGSGLGSSSAALVGGIALAYALASGGNDIDFGAVFQQVAAEEGHGDNAGPAVYGGLQAIGKGPNGFVSRSLPVAPLTVAVCVPDFHYVTTEARAALPPAISREDAVGNISRALLLVEALRTGDSGLMEVTAGERLHEPYRLPAIPGASAARQAALEAGASVVVLSGAGPGLLAFAPEGHDAIGAAMVRAFASAGLRARHWTLAAAGPGLQFA